MDQYLEFAGNHPTLILAFFVVLGVFIFLEVRRNAGGAKAIGPSEAVALVNRQNAVVLDIREDAEYRAGHIIDSLNIPLSALSSRVSELDKKKKRPIIAYCRSGARSASACRTLAKHGFETVYNLSGGIAAWQNANLPTTQK